MALGVQRSVNLPRTSNSAIRHASGGVECSAKCGVHCVLRQGAVGAQHRILIPFALLGGFLAPHAVLVVVDCWHDPTNHNLLPFEVAIVTQ